METPKLNKNTIYKDFIRPIGTFTGYSLQIKELERRKNIKYLLAVLISGLMLMAVIQPLQAQNKKVLQFSGIILGEDSISGLPGVHIFVPKRQDGTTSNYMGFFSLPVLVGDSIIFSSVGYKQFHYIIPDTDEKQMSRVVEMVTDTTFLEDRVVVWPFPTEEVFKEAVLALNIPEDQSISETHLNQDLLTLMMRSAPMTAEANYRFYMDDMIYQNQYRYSMRPNPFLNPFNWAKFIKSLKEKKNSN